MKSMSELYGKKFILPCLRCRRLRVSLIQAALPKLNCVRVNIETKQSGDPNGKRLKKWNTFSHFKP